MAREYGMSPGRSQAQYGHAGHAGKTQQQAHRDQRQGRDTPQQAQHITGGAPPQSKIRTRDDRQITPFIKRKAGRNINLAGMVGTGNWKKFINKRPWWAEGAGTMGQGISKTVQGLYRPGIESLQNLPPGERIFIGHAPKTVKGGQILSKAGFLPERFKPTNLFNARAMEEMLTKGDLPWRSKGGYAAVGKTFKEAYEGAEQFAKASALRGQKLLGKPHSNIFVGNIPRGTHPITSGVGGVKQIQLPSNILNRSFNIGPGAYTESVGSVKGPVPTKSVTHGFLKRALPGANVLLGGASALGHLAGGNYGQAAMAGLSMAPGPVGWAGLAGEALLGAPSMAEQGMGSYTGPMTGRNYNRGGIVNLYRQGGF